MDTEGTSSLVFSTEDLWQCWKLLFWKLHKISVCWIKKIFLLPFFRCFFLPLIFWLNKGNIQYCFGISVVLWIRSDGLWKKIIETNAYWEFLIFFKIFRNVFWVSFGEKLMNTIESVKFNFIVIPRLNFLRFLNFGNIHISTKLSNFQWNYVNFPFLSSFLCFGLE